MLEIQNLKVGALKNLSLSVKAGECVAIVGESGCGKTTLLNAIAGYIHYNGEIFLAGKNLHETPPWARNCRYLNQHLFLFPHKTVLGNLLLAGPCATQTEILDLLNKLKIAHLKDRYPKMLSGGEKQRVALARALINPPDLLLLDEPFSALDWDTRQHIWYELKDLIAEKQLTSIIVSHEPKETAFLAHRTLQIAQGQLFAT